MDATPEDAAHITPEDAARTLSEIRASQARLIRSRPWFPAWYTTGVGLYVTGIQFFTEPGTSVGVMRTGIGVLTVALIGLVLALVLLGHQRPHRALVTWRVLGIFGAWLVTALVLCFVLALALSAVEVPYARTFAALVMTVYMAVTGPPVARRITRRMAATIEAG
ncbi:hypothetical protein [Sphaerisporangium aureirubrum]|uniref:Uncharacterized protein n=1 Tax=Sphaerisporangium aureirubrum TaxID=1544736 RepID=A0ABW1NMG0_9ACTN